MPSETRRHICFIAPRFPEMSGGGTVVDNLARAFHEAGSTTEILSIYPGDDATAHDVTVVLTREALHRYPVSRSGSLPDRLRALPAAGFKRFDRARRLRTLRRHVEGLPSDSVVIFTHVMAKALLDESGYVRGEGGPIFIGQHHSSFASLEDEPRLRELLPRHFGDCDAFVALTDADASLFAPLVGVPSVAIPNPASRHVAVGDPMSKRAVALARFSHEKQIPLMVDLFARAAQTPALHGWTLTVHGEGDDLDAVRHLVDERGLHESIRCPGPIASAVDGLSGASLNLLTSKLEGFGMTILEAGQAGIPTVAFACSAGVIDQMEDGAGFLVPNQDETAYVDALREAMSDDDERVRRGARAAERAARFAPRAIVTRWDELFATLR